MIGDLSERPVRRSAAFSLATCICLATLAAAGAADAPLPPGYTTTLTGNMDDFAYFAGAWTTHQRRLKQRGTGSDKWETFPATLCMTEYLDGKATVDELNFPTKGWAGLTVRTFDVKKRQWSIYWVSSATGVMGAPVIGGFDGKHGEFYGEDSDNGRPVAVRFIWDKLDRNPRRQQAVMEQKGTPLEKPRAIGGG